jgi:tetratricopeptide (TPR) repeat protein
MPDSAQKGTLQGAVFLSYASQDAEAARAICDALRVAGVEVWFDRSELRGGDAWDRDIRRQIKECALFMPVISENTQARPEGYFRLEWKLAVDRSHLLADDHPFFFPVVIGNVAEAAARVPEKFKEVQWTRLRLDETPDELASRVARILSGARLAAATLGSASHAAGAAAGGKKRRFPAWLIAVAIIFVPVIVVTLRPRRSPEEIAKLIAMTQTVAERAEKDSAEAAPAPTAVPVSEARQLVSKARALFENPDVTNRENMLLAEQICDKAVALDPADAEVWAARSQLSYTMYNYGHDRSSSREALMSSDAQRAVALDPSSYEARLAMAMSLTRHKDRWVEDEQMFRTLINERPDDKRALLNFGHLQRFQGKREEAFALFDRAAAVPGGDPIALADKANVYFFEGDLADAEKAVDRSIAQAPTPRAHLIDTLLQLVAHGDVDKARDELARVPLVSLQQSRAINIATTVWLWRREPDRAIEFLRGVPQDYIEDIYYTGPKLVLEGRAEQQAGPEEAAPSDRNAAMAVQDTRG